MSDRIDAHVHFWRLARGDYAWIQPSQTALYRDFGADDIRPHLDAAGIDRILLVQAAATVAETEFMLAQADAHDMVAGVVGWIDMERADAAATLARLAGNPYLKGIRPMIQDIAQTDWMLRDTLTPAYRAVVERDLVFECLVKPPHLPHLHDLLARHPDMRAVICHGAKPDIAAGAFADWAGHMARLAAETKADCKLSGLITEAGPDWSADGLRRYVDHLLDRFGPDRLIWGSDWPVLTETAGYGDWWRAVNACLADLSTDDTAKIFGGNAARVYKL